MIKIEEATLGTGADFWTPEGLGASGIDPIRAIAELVANSFDWARDDTTNREIKLIFDDNMFGIFDNGVGMTREHLKTGIQLRKAKDAIRERIRERKGMFGSGMKIAVFSLGWHIEIFSRHEENPGQEHKMTIDCRKIQELGEKWKHGVPIETINYQEGDSYENKEPECHYLNGSKSGTFIKVSDLCDQGLFNLSFRDQLSEKMGIIFGPELINNDDIEFSIDDYYHNNINLPVSVESLKTRVNWEWQHFKLDDEQIFIEDKDGNSIQVKGWLGLAKPGDSGSGSGKWGFNLFYQNQCMEIYHQDTQSMKRGLMTKNPHPTVARTLGEIHLDMCSPTVDKTGFDRNTEQWKEVQRKLKDYIDDIMKASQDSYKKSKRGSIIKKTRIAQKAKSTITNKAQEIFVNTMQEFAIDEQSWTITSIDDVEFSDELGNKIFDWNLNEASKELIPRLNISSEIYLFSSEQDDRLKMLYGFCNANAIFNFLIDSNICSRDKADEVHAEYLNTYFKNL